MVQSDSHITRFEELISGIFSELGDFQCVRELRRDGGTTDVAVVSESSGKSYSFEVRARERITPQVADDLFARFQAEPLPDHVIRVVYAPVISPRVAELAQRYGISFMDYAGNCRIVNGSSNLLISRSGIRNKAPSRQPETVDLFSPKSSRIVRVMLAEPARGWRVSELAEHPEVDVSVGLASKIKHALIRQNYAVLKNRLLYLKRPLELLDAWTKDYSGPSGQREFYMRGDTQHVERRIATWCEESNVEYALARFSAAWRLAPEVRYSVASLYVSEDALSPTSLKLLRDECGAKEVESGANLMLLSPFDERVFARRESTPEQVTSPLQTYLDLKTMAGRGSEAAEAVFEKHLRTKLASSDAEMAGA